MAQPQDDRDWPDWPAAGVGSYVTPAKIKRTFWDSSRVTHDPDDPESKDWANSEPDPKAP